MLNYFLNIKFKKVKKKFKKIFENVFFFRCFIDICMEMLIVLEFWLVF